jgi:hypothetical protein
LGHEILSHDLLFDDFRSWRFRPSLLNLWRHSER